MPLYEFQCPTCKNKFDKIRPMPQGKELVLADCPECGSLCRKVFSTCNWQFSIFLKELDKGTIL